MVWVLHQQLGRKSVVGSAPAGLFDQFSAIEADVVPTPPGLGGRHLIGEPQHVGPQALQIGLGNDPSLTRQAGAALQLVARVEEHGQSVRHVLWCRYDATRLVAVPKGIRVVGFGADQDPGLLTRRLGKSSHSASGIWLPSYLPNPYLIMTIAS
jgi:hypothetical protein